jgi:hypothetical protein
MLRMLAANSLSAFSVISNPSPVLPGGGATPVRTASASSQTAKPPVQLPVQTPTPQQAQAPRGTFLNLSV